MNTQSIIAAVEQKLSIQWVTDGGDLFQCCFRLMFQLVLQFNLTIDSNCWFSFSFYLKKGVSVSTLFCFTTILSQVDFN